jgi:hypothetical protein
LSDGEAVAELAATSGQYAAALIPLLTG